MSEDDSTIVTVQADPSIQIWTTGLNEPASRARQISHGRNDGASGLDWMPDGRIVFARQTGDIPHIWIMNGEGTETRQLTSGEAADGDGVVSTRRQVHLFHIKSEWATANMENDP